MKNQQLYFLLGKILVHTFNRTEEMFGTILDVRVQEDPLYHDQWFVSIQWNGYQGVTEYHLVKAGDNIEQGITVLPLNLWGCHPGGHKELSCFIPFADGKSKSQFEIEEEE